MQALVAAICIAVIAVVFAVFGVRVAHLFTLSGYANCKAQDCSQVGNNFIHSVKSGQLNSLIFFVGIALVYLAPALIGIFWGAPLVARELETGSHRLVWNQSVTRTRWLMTKMVLIGFASMITAGLISFAVTWASAPIDTVGIAPGALRFDPVLFGSRAFAPVGYALFCFTLGVTLGLFIRRTLPAMAVTFALFVAIQIVVPLAIRPHYQTPSQAVALISGRPLAIGLGPGGQLRVSGAVTVPAGSWILNEVSLNPDGSIFKGQAPSVCFDGPSGPEKCIEAVVALHLTDRVTYQPANRYWLFQAIETGLFILLGLALAGLSVWRVRRIS
jgi:ABC-type transport system involved in multi-copper enzyme maturation permease subunit